MSSARQDLLRLLENLPDDISLPEIETRIQAALDEAYDQLPPEGITRFHGQPEELDGKVLGPGALELAQWEGLQLTWSYEPAAAALCLHVAMGERPSSPPLIHIPLNPDEIQIVRDCAEPAGWGYYELKIEENDDRGAVTVLLNIAEDDPEPVSLIWFLDRNHRSAIARGVNRAFGEHLLTG